VFGALLASLVVAGCVAPAASPPPPAAGVYLPEHESAIVDRTNQERIRRGLAPLTVTGELRDLARSWSHQVASTGVLQHRNLQAVLDGDRRFSAYLSLGENVHSMVPDQGPEAIVAGWMSSGGHRANLLDPYWTRIGVGVFRDANGKVWTTQDFGR
jgi:uncharacterized protein YkwD